MFFYSRKSPLHIKIKIFSFSVPFSTLKKKKKKKRIGRKMFIGIKEDTKQIMYKISKYIMK